MNKIKIPKYLESAMKFDKTYFDVPVKESKEGFVKINDIFKGSGLVVYFSNDVTGDKKKIYAVRKGLCQPLVEVVKQLGKDGLTLRFEYAYRTVSVEKKIYLEMVKRMEEKYPKLDRETQLSMAGIYAAWNLATAAHVGGSAVDVTLATLDGKTVDMGTKYLESGPKTTTNSKLISQKAQMNRQILLRVMKKNGFANYPYEYWHFSMGDKIATKVQRGKFAIYGPIIYNINNKSVKFLPLDKQTKRFID